VQNTVVPAGARTRRPSSRGAQPTVASRASCGFSRWRSTSDPRRRWPSSPRRCPSRPRRRPGVAHPPLAQQLPRSSTSSPRRICPGRAPFPSGAAGRALPLLPTSSPPPCPSSPRRCYLRTIKHTSGLEVPLVLICSLPCFADALIKLIVALDFLAVL
jgi:hypothetical protein